MYSNIVICILTLSVIYLIVLHIKNDLIPKPIENIKEHFDYIVPKIEIKYSYDKKCRGVFSLVHYKEGDIIEIAPVILNQGKLRGLIEDYIFCWDKKTSLIAFGYSSMYNHSDEPNTDYIFVDDERIKITANRDIFLGEELTISYGEAYWEGRDYVKND